MAEETVQEQGNTQEEGLKEDFSSEYSAVHIPQAVRNLHNKALNALERSNVDTAIDLFFKCVQQCPQFLAARRNLRVTEIERYKARKGANPINHYVSSATGIFSVMKVKSFLKSEKYDEAIVELERLLMSDPLNMSFVKLYSEVAAAAKMYDIGSMTLEIIKERMPPGNSEIIEIMGTYYYSIKNYGKARDFLEKVHFKKPNDDKISRMLKDSEALDTLNKGWTSAEGEGDYRKALADTKEAALLEQQGKMVKTESDIDTLIAEARAKLDAEPNNINYYLNLSSLYAQQKRYDDALKVIEEARERVAADPELDRRFSNVTVEKFNAEIEALHKSGNESAAAEKEAVRDQYIFNDIAERVTKYPNDTHLRYELGLQYFTYKHYDDAIQQLQIAQKNPKDKVSALYYLALCFRIKGLLDMAVAQLEQALELLPTMNADKMNIYYLMGEICEEEGRLDDAAKYFKEIYRVDVRYRDISKRVEAIYAAQKKAR